MNTPTSKSHAIAASVDINGTERKLARLTMAARTKNDTIASRHDTNTLPRGGGMSFQATVDLLDASPIRTNLCPLGKRGLGSRQSFMARTSLGARRAPAPQLVDPTVRAC